MATEAPLRGYVLQFGQEVPERLIACGATGAKMGKINAEWHKSNRMPAKATLDQRVTWHLEHKKHCGCRSDLPRSIQQEFDRRAKAK